MHSTAEGEPIADIPFPPSSSVPRERAAPHPHSARPAGGARTSGDGPPAAPRVLPTTTQPKGQLQRFLRHRLTSPEKRTVKRIEALRSELFGGTNPPSADLARAKILSMLREDRGLAQGLEQAEAYEHLTSWLVDDNLAGRPAAEIVGLFLREVGAMERPELSAPRVKAALRVLNEVLFGDEQDGPLAQGVREFRLEKRDGGLQIVAHLRANADEAAVQAGAQRVLRAGGYPDVDVRIVSRIARA